MAKEIENSNPFLDDEDVDDFEFLNHPKQGRSGYMLSSEESKDRNELENKRMQLLEEKRLVEERIWKSTNSSLVMLHESEQVGILTAEELLKQREQLENIEGNLDTINNTMKTSQKHLNSIKSFFGGVKNYFSKENASDSAVQPTSKTFQKIPSSLHDTVGNLQSDTHLSEATHPAFRHRDLPYDGNQQISKEIYSSSSTRFSNDIEGKIDQNLEHLSDGLGRLKNLAIGLNSEIEQQNDMIDSIHNKADKADETLEYQNRQIKRILKK